MSLLGLGLSFVSRNVVALERAILCIPKPLLKALFLSLIGQLSLDGLQSRNTFKVCEKKAKDIVQGVLMKNLGVHPDHSSIYFSFSMVGDLLESIICHDHRMFET